MENYKKSLLSYWKEPKLSTKKEWLSYSDDKKSRADVNFEKNSIKLETIASSQEEAKRRFKLSLAKVVTVDNKTVQQNDPLEKMLSQVKKPEGVITKQVKNEPILSNVIFDKKPTKAAVSEYVNTNIDDAKIKEENSKVSGLKLYTLEIPLPADTMQKKAQQYEDVVKVFAVKEGLNPALVFAVIQTESSFNPRATSYVPAYGLMQIVPATAGVDAYNYLHSEKKLVSGEYLYDSTNNIEMGSAYLHILYYNYFKDVKDPLSRLFCSIAAYNTGSGNVAWVFNKEKNMSEKQKLLATLAATDINALSSDEVYNKLINELKYDEARQYLKNVSNRALAFSKLYSKN
jgi:membrane-bound lytic murein transglycosylase C